MSTDSDDPSVIRSIAVTAKDVVAAAEANRTSDRTAVLRVTPQFSGRMRARLHVQQGDEQNEDAIHIQPSALVTDQAPPYPRPADTEDELRADPDREYSVEAHREYHEEAVDDWRAALADAIRDSLTLSTPGGTNEVTVHVLGDS